MVVVVFGLSLKVAPQEPPRAPRPQFQVGEDVMAVSGASRVEALKLSGTKIAPQNRSDRGCKQARNDSDAEITGFFASPAEKNR